MGMKGKGAIVVRLNSANLREQSNLGIAKQEAQRLALKEGTSFCVYVPVVKYIPPQNRGTTSRSLEPAIVHLEPQGGWGDGDEIPDETVGAGFPFAEPTT